MTARANHNPEAESVGPRDTFLCAEEQARFTAGEVREAAHSAMFIGAYLTVRSPQDAEKLLRTLAACESGSACLDKYGLRHAERLRKQGLRYCGITRAVRSAAPAA